MMALEFLTLVVRVGLARKEQKEGRREGQKAGQREGQREVPAPWLLVSQVLALRGVSLLNLLC